PPPGEEPDAYYDVDGDGFLTPFDILLIVDELNRQASDLAQGEGEAPAVTGSYGSGDVSLKPLDDGVSLLAVPDYSQPDRIAPVTLTASRGGQQAQRPNAPAAFATLDDDDETLLDLALDSVLDDIAEDIGEAGSDALSEDWAMQDFASI
ncbi:MAG: hypothetical protein JJ992_15655, partial [Planctomycetes bacterium]|nr:hypothetical protein [Planctomycetota bacterium]